MGSTTMNLGRGTVRNLQSDVTGDECLCYRPRRMVICVNCGFKRFGRVHYICLRHPQTSFLLDWPHCPNCKGYSLCEY